MGERILVVDDSPTIRKVVANILRRKDYEPLFAEDGRDALNRLKEVDVDLVLVDFVMPRMNGYQFCLELRKQPGREALPIVLMSAKGDKIRGRFVEQTGALDAITKPFDARGLVAVIESALKKKEQGVHPSTADDADEPQSGPRSSADHLEIRRHQAAMELGNALAKALAPSLEGVDAKSVEALGDAIRYAVTPPMVRSLAEVLRTVDFGEEAGEVLSGDVGVISISEILQLLDMQRQSGALTVTTNRAQITLFIGGGHLDFAAQTGLPEEFLLGRYLVEGGTVSRDELDQALRARDPKDSRVLGDYLVEENIVSDEALRAALQQQSAELLYEVVRWKKGRFRFHHGAENPMAQKAALQMPTGGLVMEGFRRVDEWRLIEDSFDFNDVLHRDELAIQKLSDESKLTDAERAVLDRIDGDVTVGELVDALEGGSYEICKILYQLLNSRLVRRRAAA